MGIIKICILWTWGGVIFSYYLNMTSYDFFTSVVAKMGQRGGITCLRLEKLPRISVYNKEIQLFWLTFLQ